MKFIQVYSDGCNGLKRGPMVEGDRVPAGYTKETANVFVDGSGENFLIQLDDPRTLSVEELEEEDQDNAEGDDD